MLSFQSFCLSLQLFHSHLKVAGSRLGENDRVEQSAHAHPPGLFGEGTVVQRGRQAAEFGGGKLPRHLHVSVVGMKHGLAVFDDGQGAAFHARQQGLEVDSPAVHRGGHFRLLPFFLLIVNLHGQQHQGGEGGHGHLHDRIAASGQAHAAVLRGEQLFHPSFGGERFPVPGAFRTPVSGEQVVAVVQHLLPDTAFLCDFRQIRRRVDVPLRAVRIDVFYPEMQMFAARLSELLPGLDSIPGLDGGCI